MIWPNPACRAFSKRLKTRKHWIPLGIGIPQWLTQQISVAAGRPPRCPRCDRPSHRDGCTWLHGHGVVTRCVLGPRTPGSQPEQLVLGLRRYQCQGCGAIATVGPRGILRGRLYSGTSIAYALALAQRESQTRVREMVSPWRSSSVAKRWRNLQRWAEAGLAGRLWRLDAPKPTRLEDLIGRLIAFSPSGGHGDPAHLAFCGAK